jgi:hypothetical protein
MHQLPALRAPNSTMPNPNPNMCSLFRATYDPKLSMQDPSLQSRSKMPPHTNNVQILQDPTQIFQSELPNQSYDGGKSSNEKAIWNPPRGPRRASSRSGNNTTSTYGPSGTYTEATNNNTARGPTNCIARGRRDASDTTTEQSTYPRNIVENQNPNPQSAPFLLQIFMLNCAKAMTTTTTIEKFARDPDCYIFLLQESWNEKNGQPPTHPNFDFFTPTINKPKCAIYVRHLPDISATTTFTYCNSFLTNTIHMSNQINFDLCNFYLPKRQLIADLTKSLIPSLSTILMGGLNIHHPFFPNDFNIHHPWWSNNSEARPELNLPASLTTVEWLETYDFRLHNYLGHPTYCPHMANSRPSVLDICLSTGPATEYIEAWSIDDESGSDHSIVGLLLPFKRYDNNSPKSLPTLQKRRNWSKADWSKFQRILNEGNPERQVAYLHTESQILDAFKSILALINHILDESVPVITYSPKRIPWWNPNLNWICTRLNRAEHRWRTNHENKDKLIASQIRAI